MRIAYDILSLMMFVASIVSYYMGKPVDAAYLMAFAVYLRLSLPLSLGED